MYSAEDGALGGRGCRRGWEGAAWAGRWLDRTSWRVRKEFQNRGWCTYGGVGSDAAWVTLSLFADGDAQTLSRMFWTEYASACIHRI